MSNHEGKVIFCAPVKLSAYNPGSLVGFTQTAEPELFVDGTHQQEVSVDIWYANFDKAYILDLVNPDNHYELWIVKKEK